MLVTKPLTVAIDFHCIIFSILLKSMDAVNGFITNILQQYYKY